MDLNGLCVLQLDPCGGLLGCGGKTPFKCLCKGEEGTLARKNKTTLTVIWMNVIKSLVNLMNAALLLMFYIWMGHVGQSFSVCPKQCDFYSYGTLRLQEFAHGLGK